MSKEKVVLPIMLSPIKAMTIVSQIQLALRHPDNQGPGAALARHIALEITNDLTEVHPDFEKLLAMGWDPRYDGRADEFMHILNKIGEEIDLM
jgi:hypothetical protein